MWDVYPRPQLVRDNYLLLNGQWQLNGRDIIVPYPPESELSGYIDGVSSTMIYKKEFTFKKSKDLVLLHFGAVDAICEVYLNGSYVGEHIGGYLPFTLDITPYIQKENTLVVKAIDELDKNLPYGKQSKKSRGMWYTQVSGIWQSVWIEEVNIGYIKDIQIKTTLDKVELSIDSASKEFEVEIPAINFKEKYKDKNIVIKIDNPHLWDISDPYLYDMKISTKSDSVQSYFALREVKMQLIGKAQKLFLNNNPIFINGVLDQGYYKKGIYTPEVPEDYLKDIQRMHNLGFNTLRKHAKVEPDIFYYYCDKEGMLVLQDMVHSGRVSYVFDTLLPNLGFKYKFDLVCFNKQRKNFFVKHCKDTMHYLNNHPSVIGYTIFNEGWGQVQSDEIYTELKSLDETRIFDSTSGWFHQRHSDVQSVHMYFTNRKLNHRAGKILMLTECGGFKCKISDHIAENADYGYGKNESVESLTKTIKKLYKKTVIPSIPRGLCGVIYTQLSDVENEINGIYTYDREVCKVNRKELVELFNEIYENYN